jgi:hypothetical protein
MCNVWVTVWKRPVVGFLMPSLAVRWRKSEFRLIGFVTVMSTRPPLRTYVELKATHLGLGCEEALTAQYSVD